MHFLPEGNSRVTGIDNDQSWGLVRHPRALTPKKDTGFRGVGLPPLVDVAMARTFLSLNETDVRSIVGDLVPEGLPAASSRLEAIQNHIKALPESHIIAAYEWDSEAATRLLADRHSSYVGRELAALNEENSD